MPKGLDKFTVVGQSLLDEQQATEAHTAFNQWVSEVGHWLADSYPNSGLSADWAAQGNSRLVLGSQYHDDLLTWSMFRMVVEGRLRWLGNLPVRAELRSSLLTPTLVQNEAKQTGRKEIKLQTTSRAYVDPDRINELKAVSSSQFDLSKLITLCEEINVCFAGECYLAMTMLTRSILDHVPPIFGCRSFNEIANNYQGTRSFKDAMQQLESSSRKIADHYLHGQIRSAESLPNVTQIDFSNTLDLLLAEIARLMKSSND